MTKKKTILFLFPGAIFRPDLPDFKDRFEILSDAFGGLILTRTWESRFECASIGGFEFRAIPKAPSGFSGRLKMAFFIIREAIKFSRVNKVDFIVCYDPMFTGILGVLLRVFIRAKLIIEVNSDRIGGAVPLFYGTGLRACIKDYILRGLTFTALFFCDAVKVLSPRVEDELLKKFPKKKVFCFHDFVPTHYFGGETVFKKEILFVGFPFILKGVDVLVRAFDRIKDRHPDFTLRLIGHRLQEQAGEFFKNGELGSKIIFQKGMFYDELREYFLNCYCMVLPSRTEGMGRVLIEAMASGKPVIGSRVGGIPGVIEDGRNGFLFENENVDQLAGCLERLMSDESLAKRMGTQGRFVVEERFSTRIYVQKFNAMIDEIDKGIRYA